ncbi:MAG TPA: PP2C family protein-serine/threonine phosphatase [Solirubrobacteraceae bacterium]|nr:PP2C family protein-serine/threonine phosphatase [Solirubrobacteraceae bacterium]
MTEDVSAAQILSEVAPHELPSRILREAQRAAGAPVGVYVIDIDGSCLLLLSGGGDGFPESVAISGAVGPELPLGRVGDVAVALATELPGAQLVPMQLRDRALGFFVTRAAINSELTAIAREAALALELISGYTDAVHATRRHRRIDPAAEIQQNLLPPRLARVPGGSLAGGVLPGYDVGGDFVDYACNEDALWLAIGDGVGKGNEAAGLASLTVGALRAARRSDADLKHAIAIMHQTIYDSGRDRTQFVTAIVARWDDQTGVLEWINCGHPHPLIISADGECTELSGATTFPLGLFVRERRLSVATHRLARGDRLLLYSDGISERRSVDGVPLGIETIVATMRATSGAADTVRALQNTVNDASPRPLRDDATLLVLALDR